MKHYPFLFSLHCLVGKKIKMPQANTFAVRYYYRILCAEIKICEHCLPLLIFYQPLPSSLTNINVICKFEFFSAENVHVYIKVSPQSCYRYQDKCMTIRNFFSILFKRNTVKVEVEDLDAEKLLGVVIKDRVKETQNPGLDLKEETHPSIFGFLSMVLKMCK